MKALFILAAGLGLAVGSLQAADAAKSARADIVFDHPEKFTDVKDGLMTSVKSRDAILNRIRSHIASRANRYIPEGCKLTITFSNIDLAGEFEPWRGAAYDDIRIVKSIYPPAFKFTWSVTNAAGKIVKQGKENMRVVGFETMFTLDQEDPLRYEKAILDDWMRSNLEDIKKIVVVN